MNAEQTALFVEYHNRVASVYRALEHLKEHMNAEPFKALIDEATSESCTDPELVTEMGIVYGDFDVFVQDLPNAVSSET